MSNKPEWIFILNPTAGGRRKIRHELEDYFTQIKKHNIYAKIVLTKDYQDIIDSTIRVVKTANTIIAVGGDGTLNGVVNGIMRSRNKDVRLGIFPLGGGNDLARHFSIKANIKRYSDNFQNLKIVKLDVFKLNDVCFVNSAGVGFVALVAKYGQSFSGMPGFIRYRLAVVRAFAQLKYYPLRIETDEGIFEDKYIFCHLGNGIYSGAGFKITPDADATDGLLDVCLVKEASLKKIIRTIPKISRGLHTNEPEVEIIRTKRIKITSQTQVPVYYDGEIISETESLELIVEPAEQKINLIIS